MLTLTRPKSGRIVSGVASGISELYGISVWMVRIGWLAAMLTWPIVLLVYLLFSIAMPNEASVVGELSIDGLENNLTPAERFTRFSQIMVSRLMLRRSDYAKTNSSASIALLILGAILELSKVDGTRFYFEHPVIASIFADFSRVGVPVFYIALGGIFLTMRPARSLAISVELPLAEKFALDHSVRKMIGGVASGMSSVIRIDPAYTRVLLLLLNILTFGIAGVIYLLVLFIFRRKERGEVPNVVARSLRFSESQYAGETPPLRGKGGTLFHFAVALLFLFLAAVRISIEFRFFFFNEPLIQGLVIALVGIAIAWRGAYSASIEDRPRKSSISLLAGSSIFFAGIYFLAIAVGRVSITIGTSIEIAEIIMALSFAYFGLIALNGAGRRLAFLLAIFLGLSAACVGLHVALIHDLAAVGQFYDFFYPVILGVLALWIAFEK